MSSGFWFMISVVAAMAMSLVAVLGWFNHRKREREAHYRAETVRRITETGDGAAALKFLEEVERAEALRTRNGARLAGLVTIAAGAGLMLFLSAFVAGAPVYLVGLIPVFVGVALLIFTEFILKAPR